MSSAAVNRPTHDHAASLAKTSAFRGPAHQLAVRMRINNCTHGHYGPSNQPCTSNCTSAEGLHFSAFHYYQYQFTPELYTILYFGTCCLYPLLISLSLFSVSLSVSQSVSLSICQPVYLSVSQSVSQSVSLSACLSVCQSVSLSVSQSVCLSVCLSMFFSPFIYFQFPSAYIPHAYPHSLPPFLLSPVYSIHVVTQFHVSKIICSCHNVVLCSFPG